MPLVAASEATGPRAVASEAPAASVAEPELAAASEETSAWGRGTEKTVVDTANTARRANCLAIMMIDTVYIVSDYESRSVMRYSYYRSDRILILILLLIAQLIK